jgi:hypothetical protein
MLRMCVELGFTITADLKTPDVHVVRLSLSPKS